jgi:hypothetical protein
MSLIGRTYAASVPVLARATSSCPTYHTAYASIDGSRWGPGLTWTRPSNGNGRIALVSMGAPGGFDSIVGYLRVYRLAEV